MRVSELEGELLRRYVAIADGMKVERDGDHEGAAFICWDRDGEPFSFTETGYCPDIKWEYGGPIIEREGITIAVVGKTKKVWFAEMGGAESDHSVDVGYGKFQEEGPTPLIAAMRAYVASQFGDTVEE